jgi:hypothetical protein
MQNGEGTTGSGTIGQGGMLPSDLLEEDGREQMYERIRGMDSLIRQKQDQVSSVS